MLRLKASGKLGQTGRLGIRNPLYKVTQQKPGPLKYYSRLESLLTYVYAYIIAAFTDFLFIERYYLIYLCYAELNGRYTSDFKACVTKYCGLFKGIITEYARWKKITTDISQESRCLE